VQEAIAVSFDTISYMISYLAYDIIIWHHTKLMIS
jgi:hypothetical protein